jgi:hypothetical protein
MFGDAKMQTPMHAHPLVRLLIATHARPLCQQVELVIITCQYGYNADHGHAAVFFDKA